MYLCSSGTIFLISMVLLEAFHTPSLKCRRHSQVLSRQSINMVAGPLDSFLGLFKPSGESSASKLEKIEKLKSSLFGMAEGTSNGVKASQKTRDDISEIVSKLELMNPVKGISNSPLMNGNWKLIYTTNSGSSAGRLGAFIGRVDQDIDLSTRKYINYVRLGGIVQGALSATWDDVSPKLWRVKFIDVAITVFGIPIKKKSLEGSVGIWRMSYIDDNIRVLYAQGGKNQETENIYILAKEKF